MAHPAIELRDKILIAATPKDLEELWRKALHQYSSKIYVALNRFVSLRYHQLTKGSNHEIGADDLKMYYDSLDIAIDEESKNAGITNND